MTSRESSARPHLLGWILLAASVVLLVVVLLTGNERLSAAQHQADTASRELQEARGRLEGTVGQVEARRAQVVEQGTGQDLERVERDTERIEDLAAQVLTWENGADYRRQRERILRTSGLDEESPLLRDFMPADTCVEHKDGSRTCTTDAHRLSSSGTVDEVLVVGIEGNQYTYLVNTETTVHSGEKVVSRDRQMPLLVTLGPDGKFVSAEMYATYEPIRRSN